MKVGFIGVGNMGGPMCRNIIKRSNHQVTVFDLNAAAVKTCTDLGGTAGTRGNITLLNAGNVFNTVNFTGPFTWNSALNLAWNRNTVPKLGAGDEIISPAGFEHFFWGVTELASSGPPDPELIAALAAEHGLVFGNAPWLEDVIARYDLTPPPGGR